MPPAADRQPTPTASRLLAGAGWVYALLGAGLVLALPLRHLARGPESSSVGGTTTALIITAGLILAASGTAFVRWRDRPVMVNAHLAFLSLLLFSPLMGEGILRAGIAMGLETFRRPELYADYFGDDAYHQLRLRWQPARADTVAGRFHPLLGWAPPVSEANPLGLSDDHPPRPAADDPVVLFYGDSFVAGASVASDERIPQLLDGLLPGHDVLNLGVGGFGLDQIYLRFGETHGLFTDPVVVVGLLTTDLDRTVLSFRTGPKPWFSLNDGELILHGAPMERDSAAWKERFEPAIRSYLGAALQRLGDRLTRPPGPAESRYRRAEKEAVNGALLERLADECRSAGQPLLFVIFPAYLETGQRGWREAFLEQRLQALGVPWIDTEALLQAEAGLRHVDVGDFMLDDGHLNPQGNALVAGAVADRLAQGFGLKRAPGPSAGGSPARPESD